MFLFESAGHRLHGKMLQVDVSPAAKKNLRSLKSRQENPIQSRKDGGNFC